MDILKIEHAILSQKPLLHTSKVLSINHSNSGAIEGPLCYEHLLFGMDPLSYHKLLFL